MNLIFSIHGMPKTFGRSWLVLCLVELKHTEVTNIGEGLAALPR